MKKNMLVSLGIGLILSSIALYVALRNVPFNELWLYLSEINYFWIFPSALLVVIAFAFRALRWQIILSTIHRVSYSQAFHPLMIGFMLNCIFPGRLGEVARPMILKNKNKIAFTTGLATVAAERIFDLVFLIGALAAILSTLQIDPQFKIDFAGYSLTRETLLLLGKGVIKLSLILLIGISLVALDASRNLIKKAIQHIPKLLFFLPDKMRTTIDQKICLRMNIIIDHISEWFLLLKHPKKIFTCLALTIIIWGISAFSYLVMAKGCPGIDLSLYEFTAVMIIISFFIALPSVPGFWGVWEAGGVFAMVLLGISHETAAGYTLTNHVVQVFPVVIVGLMSAMVISVNILQVSQESSSA